MSAVSDSATATPDEGPLERQVLRKVTLRLIPFLGLLYFVNILDRVNIGFARLHTYFFCGNSRGAKSWRA
jgi:hypothetical protein